MAKTSELKKSILMDYPDAKVEINGNQFRIVATVMSKEVPLSQWCGNKKIAWRTAYNSIHD
jgi:hypothetical protein